MNNKLEAAEKHSWLIIEAFMHRISALRKAINDGKASIADPGPNCPPILLRSLEGTVAECERMLTANVEALKELRDAGWK